MRCLLNVEQEVQLFYGLEGAEGDVESESQPESEDFNDEVDDPSFVLEEERENEEHPMCTQSDACRAAQRKGQLISPTRSRSPLTPTAEPHLSGAWKTE